MIPILTREAVRALDADAAQRLGVPTLVLMENAGRGAFELLRSRFAGSLAQVAIFGGVGQNGGDAWVVARHLVVAGFQPRCVLVGERAKVRGDAATNLRVLEQLGVRVASCDHAQEWERSSQVSLKPVDGRSAQPPGDDEPATGRVPVADGGEVPRLVTSALDGATLILDGLFGTGLDRAIGGLQARVIEAMNAAAAPRVALDIPSGVDANSGGVLGVAIRADVTVTFASHKRGLHQHPGAALAGELQCASIGVPAPRTAACSQLQAQDVARWLPPRSADAHKGTGGHVLVIAGAPGRTGAAVLSGLGALRAGAGLVTLCPRAGARDALDMKVIELMTEDMPAELEPALAAVTHSLSSKHAAVLGPGFGVDAAARALLVRLALELDKPCVMDADALTAFTGELPRLRQARAARVLTPHPAEAARLLGNSAADVQADRYAAAARLAAESGQVSVLKGARTLIAHPDGRIHVCPLDTPALAVAGTGDVLSGVVAALLSLASKPDAASREFGAFEAASAAVYLHARAGALAASSDRGLFAREVATAVPRALEACRAEAAIAGAG